MDTMIHFGGEVKALENGKLGGYLIRFSKSNEPDLTGDFFDADTDLGEPSKLPVLYHHGLDPQIKRRRIGTADVKRDDLGLWVEAQLNLRDEYEKKVYELAKQNKLGWSSGAAAHAVERTHEGKSAHISQWYIAEASLTPTPAEPRNTVFELKCLLEDEAEAAQAAQSQSASTDNTVILQEKIKMDEKELKALLDARDAEKEAKAKAEAEAKAKADTEKVALDAQVKAAVAESLKGVAIPQPGKATNVKKVTDLGFKDDEVKSFLHWVRTGDEVAYKAAMQGQTDSEGGYAVPDDFYNQIIAKRDQVSVMRQIGVIGIPTSLDKVLIPTEGTAATKFVVTAEEGGYDENEPTLGQVPITVHKVTKLIKISEELEADAKANYGAWLSNVWGRALGLAENYYFCNVAANGSSQPQSVTYGLVAGSAYTAGTASQTATTAAEWKAFFYGLGSAYSDRQVLLMRKSTLGLLVALAGNPFQFSPTLNRDTSTPMRAGEIDGIPIFITDDIPAQAAAVYHAVLFNPDFYAIVDREGLSVNRNPYLYQANGQIGLFAKARFGGTLLQAAGGLAFASKT